MSNSVRTVDRALDIFLCFDKNHPMLSLTEISDEIGVSKSTAHRMVKTLENRRFLLKNSTTGKYHLGYRLLEMASEGFDDLDQHWILPYLQDIVQKSGETADLAILDDDHVIYLQVIESPQRVKLTARKGQSLPAFSTASGKAFLAFLPQNEQTRIVASSRGKYASNKPMDEMKLMNDLAEVRQRGFAISEEEYEKDINAVAAPILSPEGYPSMTIALAGPSIRMPRERMMELGETVQNEISHIIREIGPSSISSKVLTKS